MYVSPIIRLKVMEERTKDVPILQEIPKTCVTNQASEMKKVWESEHVLDSM